MLVQAGLPNLPLSAQLLRISCRRPSIVIWIM